MSDVCTLPTFLWADQKASQYFVYILNLHSTIIITSLIFNHYSSISWICSIRLSQPWKNTFDRYARLCCSSWWVPKLSLCWLCHCFLDCFIVDLLFHGFIFIWFCGWFVCFSFWASIHFNIERQDKNQQTARKASLLYVTLFRVITASVGLNKLNVRLKSCYVPMQTNLRLLILNFICHFLPIPPIWRDTFGTQFEDYNSSDRIWSD